MKKCLFLLCLILLCSGCTTSVCRHYKVAPESLSSSGRIAVAGIRGQNTGCYLFNFIPVWSGKPHRPNEKKWSMWRDYVRKRDIRKMFAVRARQLGADDIEDFSVTEESSGLWSLRIIWTRTISGQCVAVKNPSEKKKNGNIPTE